MSAPKAFVFDAYGTLFDVHSVVDQAERRFPGHGAALSRLWRQKQLEYTWLRSLMGRYADFETVTRDALGHACEALGLALDRAALEALMLAYRHLAPYPEVPAVLEALAPRPTCLVPSARSCSCSSSSSTSKRANASRSIVAVYRCESCPGPPVRYCSCFGV